MIELPGSSAGALSAWTRAVKWGAIVMAVGYFMLCFGGQQAKPYVNINGARFDVAQVQSGSVLSPSTAPQTIQMNGQTLTIHGMQDKALNAAGHAGTWDHVTADTTILMIPTAGHFVQHDAQNLVDRTVRDWLNARR